ncbi:hypothetical protein PYW08_001984 [Mythimna loreyi]|uniref:Uncharacterized protein n=1 Tax=Mythimna loreyi TaxID=667449 RepID=A0ACC2R116_9NEOP|nr:hypothetical protein PYW08_001984 [Mythimna loreyi]
MALAQKKNKRKSIQQSDPGKILYLIMSLTDHRCSDIQIRINTYLCEECEADLVFHVIVNCERKEAFIDTVGTVSLPRRTIVKLSPKLLETLRSKLDQAELLSNFEDDFKNVVMPYLPKDNAKRRVILMPVDGNPFAVIFCAVAPKIVESNVPLVIHECALFVWPTLKKTIALEYERCLKTKCQQLLRVAKRLFTQVASLETLLQMASDQAKNLFQAEHCVVLLVDVEKMELYESYSPLKHLSAPPDYQERRFPLNLGISGEVISTGMFINARTASEHPLFNSTIDCLPNVKCRNLLCFPIREQGGIIGVGQVINKIVDPYFDGMDEEMALAFSIYCGICIIHSAVFQKIQEAHIRNALATELVMYHMKVSDDEVASLMDCTGYHKNPLVAGLHFETRSLPLRELPCYALKMFTDLRLDKKFDIKPQKLACFILYVKKGYRDVPYHNWTHAFNVVQWAYASIINFRLLQHRYFNDLQALMYLVASLVHDIDHRGTTNSFQVLGRTNLAALYSSEGSVMERHHLAQAMCILNTEGCDILQSLPRREFDRAIMMLRDNILSTDLSNYYKNVGDYKVIAMDFQIGNQLHFTVLQSLLMNAADLSDQIKDWASVKKTAAAVLAEFFKQGELEKLRGEQPAQSMDREKCFIPDLEIEFLTTTVIPLYDLLGKILPQASTFSKTVVEHIEKWEHSKPVFAELPFPAGLAVLLSPELDTLIELNKQEAERLERERIEAELLAAQRAKEEAEEEEDEY